MTITTANLTAYETATLELIRDGRVDYFDDGYENSGTYGFAITAAITNYLDLTEQGAGGVISSLVQKGCLSAEEYEGSTSIYVTPVGVATIQSLGAAA